MKAGKNDLYRLVRGSQGNVSLDPGGTKAGRGAYVCSVSCLESALASKRLERVLKTNMTQEDHERIILGFNKMIREA